MQTMDDGYLVCENGRIAGVFSVLPAQYADVIRGLAGNGGTAGSGGIHIHTSISVSGNGNINQQKDGGSSSQRQLADMINNQTKAIIAREMRQGGLIWNMRTGVA